MMAIKIGGFPRLNRPAPPATPAAAPENSATPTIEAASVEEDGYDEEGRRLITAPLAPAPRHQPTILHRAPVSRPPKPPAPKARVPDTVPRPLGPPRYLDDLARLEKAAEAYLNRPTASSFPRPPVPRPVAPKPKMPSPTPDLTESTSTALESPERPLERPVIQSSRPSFPQTTPPRTMTTKAAKGRLTADDIPY